MSLRAEHASLRRGDRYLLRDVSLSLSPGEVLIIVGPNGAGKSTLLNLLAGDEAPGQGVVTLMNHNLQDLTLEALAQRRAVVGTPPQLAFDFTVNDVIRMAWMHGDRYGVAAKQEVLQQVLRKSDLTALSERRYTTLSSGERQRVEFARGCMQLWRSAGDKEARWLLLDEPTANLDVAHAVMLLEALRERARAGDGVVAVLHDLDLAARFADRVGLVNNGRLETVGSVEAVLNAERLSKVYGTPIHVEHHALLKRTVVIG